MASHINQEVGETLFRVDLFIKIQEVSVIFVTDYHEKYCKFGEDSSAF